MLTGWISDADTAERVVRDGLADFAIMGRALIADSHLVENTPPGARTRSTLAWPVGRAA